jgi:hypothetical protein
MHLQATLQLFSKMLMSSASLLGRYMFNVYKFSSVNFQVVITKCNISYILVRI